MTRVTKLLSCLLLAGLLAPASFAGAGQDPQELLSRSFQQANLWSQGPVKLVASIRAPLLNVQAPEYRYTVFWAGPEKWRTEWSGPGGGQEVTVLNNGKLSSVTSQSSSSSSAVWFQAALAALDGGTPAGPYSLAPLDYKKTKLHVSKEKINGANATCVTYGKPAITLCIDPGSGHLLNAYSDLGNFEYSNYTSAGNDSYPQTVKLTLVNGGRLEIEDAQVTVTRGEQFPDSFFTVPDDSTTIDFASCTALATNFTAPSLAKSRQGQNAQGCTQDLHLRTSMGTGHGGQRRFSAKDRRVERPKCAENRGHQRRPEVQVQTLFALRPGCRISGGSGSDL